MILNAAKKTATLNRNIHQTCIAATTMTKTKNKPNIVVITLKSVIASLFPSKLRLISTNEIAPIRKLIAAANPTAVLVGVVLVQIKYAPGDVASRATKSNKFFFIVVFFLFDLKRYSGSPSGRVQWYTVF